MIPQQLTAEDAAAGVEQLIAGAAPVRPVHGLRRGRNHVSWVMSSQRGLLVVKVLVGVGTALALRWGEHERLCRAGAPVAPLLGFDLSCTMVGGLPLIVLEYLPGIDAAEALPGMDSQACEELMRDIGAAVARVHQVPVPGFGDAATGLGTGPASWPGIIAQRAYTAVVSVHPDGRSTAAVDAAAGLLVDLASGLETVTAAVAHLDVFAPNVLVDQRGRFARLLDLEHIRRVDPVADFVKPAMWMLAGRPGWTAAFADGYAAVGGWPAGWERRLAVAYGAELLSGIDYWARVGAGDMLVDYLHRLITWVDSRGAGSVWPGPVPG